jgi:RNA polymerase sigma-70 factor (ECF subfamily)
MDFQTIQLHELIDRIQKGNEDARDELIRSVGNSLERLARKMLQRYPGVHRWEETGDVLQNALLRLLRAVQEIKPPTMRDFFGLAAEQVRRELIDLARHYRSNKGLGTNLASHGDSILRDLEIADPALEEDNLERWHDFHEAVHRLPAEEREVMGLVFYHGWTQAQIAEFFQTSERTIRRRWQSACLKVEQMVRGGLPDL